MYLTLANRQLTGTVLLGRRSFHFLPFSGARHRDPKKTINHKYSTCYCKEYLTPHTEAKTKGRFTLAVFTDYRKEDQCRSYTARIFRSDKNARMIDTKMRERRKLTIF
jgi:hypothetical protein